MATHVDEIKRLFAYHYWATHKLLTVVGALTPEEYSREVAGSYGSIRNTLVHTLSAEWGWLDRCGGTPRGPRLQAEDYPTGEYLVDAWTRVEGYVGSFLATLRDDDLARTVEYSFDPSKKHASTVEE